MLSHCNFDTSLSASICRNIVIQGYSVIDAIIICAAYRLQDGCRNCNKSNTCYFYNESLFLGRDEKINEKVAFSRAEKFLRDSKILNLNSSAKNFLDEARTLRNSIHLTKTDSALITANPRFTRSYCAKLMAFLQELVEVLGNNIYEYVRENNCIFYNS
ncbi:MAG: hypothetical protein HUK24_01940 [Sphaerochaetaceae bacterium]|nr:hypothetical protein [Sphaerochaetaceae bacterium]